MYDFLEKSDQEHARDMGMSIEEFRGELPNLPCGDDDYQLERLDYLQEWHGLPVARDEDGTYRAVVFGDGSKLMFYSFDDFVGWKES